MTPIRLTLYSKARCHLCEVAAAVVEDVRRGLGVATTLETVDITTDAALIAAYKYDVPVLAVDGRPAFKHRIDPDRLRARLLHGTPAPLEEPTAP